MELQTFLIGLFLFAAIVPIAGIIAVLMPRKRRKPRRHSQRMTWK